MSDFIIAKVAVENTAYSFDMLFDYSVPDSLCSELSAGMRVLVPFGTSSKKRVGIVFSVNKVENTEKRLKKIDSILDDEPLLTYEMLKTANFVRERCFCTYFEACKMFLPLGFSMSVSVLYAINSEFSGEITDDKEKTVFDYLKEKNFSDVVAHEIDGEVRKIIFECHRQAEEVLQANLDLLATIAEYLLKVETLTKSDIDEIAATGKLAWYDEKQVTKAEEETKTETTTTDSEE